MASGVACSQVKARRLRELEANLAAIDAGCFRMLDHAGLQAHGQVAGGVGVLGERGRATSGEECDEWKERGGRMLKMMGWKEGEGLGRESKGITEPVDANIQQDKSGLGLASEKSEKVALRINERLS